MKVSKKIKRSWKKNPVETGFMVLVLSFSLLSYLRPDYTSNLLANIGLSLLSFALLALIVLSTWYFVFREDG